MQILFVMAYSISQNGRLVGCGETSGDAELHHPQGISALVEDAKGNVIKNLRAKGTQGSLKIMVSSFSMVEWRQK